MNYLEWLGYIASVIIAISMLMSSLLKLRIINLVGALAFAVYGFLLGSIPVGILNLFIAFIDIYFLSKMFFKDEYFKVLYVRANNYYLINFLDYYLKDIHKFYPGFEYKPEMNTLSFFILRNMSVAGIFLAHEIDNQKLMIGLDYAILDYRDFKLGKYVYQNLSLFKDKGYKELHSKVQSPKHKKYLEKMGFVELTTKGETFMIKTLI